MAAAQTLEVTASNFQQDVIEGSAKAPVLLDFWAAWCEPCRTLGPVLEALAEEYGGAFQLGKVDTEKEQDLAHAFGVQGIPFCVLVADGKPVDGFQGALPDKEVRAFLDKHGIKPAVAEKEPEEEVELDPDSPEARLLRALEFARIGDSKAVREELTDFPEEDERFDQVERLLAGIEWLDAELVSGGDAAETNLVAGRQLYLKGDFEGAMDRLLDSVEDDKSCKGGLARKAMLLCFAAVGEEDERIDGYRRRLATLLY